ncbi:MAG: hypothetical protein JSU86_17520 [Phycisphaerales bacterium]|nr:MAG: hypothetical protein JSU86_17520 [Phycisphaerales bacterium]
MRTVLITNGNLLSLLALGEFLCRYHSEIAAVFVTTRLPSQKSNLRGVASMWRRSGYRYTHFKLLTNVLLPRRLRRRGAIPTVVEFLKHLNSQAEFFETADINDCTAIDRVRRFRPEILLSFSATSRFCGELVETPSRVAINVHYALLPNYAGLSPYFWYLRNRESECGVTLHQIISRLDAGPIIEQQRFSMEGLRTVFALVLRQVACVSPLLNRFYSGETSEQNARPQDPAQRTYFKHPTRQDVAELKRRGFGFYDRGDLVNVACRLDELARLGSSVRSPGAQSAE